MGHVLNKVRSQEAQLILVAPVWKGQSWYPVLLKMLTDFPPPLITAGANAEGGQQWTNTPAGHLACLRKKFRNSCLSADASNFMLASWRKSSQTYDSIFNEWVSWCSERYCDPISGPIADVANFLASLFKEGYKSRSLNSFIIRSAKSLVHHPVDGIEVGKHPTISRLLKEAYHSRPPLLRYTST